MNRQNNSSQEKPFWQTWYKDWNVWWCYVFVLIWTIVTNGPSTERELSINFLVYSVFVGTDGSPFLGAVISSAFLMIGYLPFFHRFYRYKDCKGLDWVTTIFFGYSLTKETDKNSSGNIGKSNGSNKNLFARENSLEGPRQNSEDVWITSSDKEAPKKKINSLKKNSRETIPVILPVQKKNSLDNLTVKNNMYFKKASSIPFTGDVVGNVNGTVKDGKREGPWIEKRENGNIHSKTNYKNGIKEGLREEYHPNSLLAEIASYKNGLLSGKYKSFHINGLIKEKGIYINGQKDGVWSYHNQMGRIIRKEKWYKGALK